ncbi:hypothetical protein V5O48_010548 [Marasmius crinis-equi]|uniref:Uncharacterized protein n=1 Tax=Marasmius crinis-equi TaxID=585013 RepID=A0ABR3F831_9AGAR
MPRRKKQDIRSHFLRYFPKGFTRTQKALLEAQRSVYVNFRDNPLDVRRIRFWRLMDRLTHRFIWDSAPEDFVKWTSRRRKLLRLSVRNEVIRYYDWSTWSTRGVKHLQNSLVAPTPASSPIHGPMESLQSMPAFLPLGSEVPEHLMLPPPSFYFELAWDVL